MTPADAQRVLRILNGAWGYFGADNADRVTLWTEHLLTLDPEPTRKAAKRFTETSDQLPSLAAFLRAAREEARLARLAASAPALAPGENTYACRCGAWNGWELVEDGNPPTVRPCRFCRPLTREQWEGGHFAQGHSCADCERRKRAA